MNFHLFVQKIPSFVIARLDWAIYTFLDSPIKSGNDSFIILCEPEAHECHGMGLSLNGLNLSIKPG